MFVRQKQPTGEFRTNVLDILAQANGTQIYLQTSLLVLVCWTHQLKNMTADQLKTTPGHRKNVLSSYSSYQVVHVWSGHLFKPGTSQEYRSPAGDFGQKPLEIYDGNSGHHPCGNVSPTGLVVCAHEIPSHLLLGNNKPKDKGKGLDVRTSNHRFPKRNLETSHFSIWRGNLERERDDYLNGPVPTPCPWQQS